MEARKCHISADARHLLELDEIGEMTGSEIISISKEEKEQKAKELVKKRILEETEAVEWFFFGK